MFNKSIKEFSELTFSSDPVPGGGGISAEVAALAASLSGMVTNLTIGKKKYLEYTEELENIRNRADGLRMRLLAAINEDAECFYPLSKAYAMDKNTEGYAENLEVCLKQAASSPMNIVKLCTEVIDLDVRLATIGSKLSVSDAGTSVVLAYGALKAAYLNVVVNTRLMKDKAYANALELEAKRLVAKYEAIVNETYNKVLERL